MGQDQDDVVLVPYTTGSMRIFGQRHLRNVTIAVDDTSLMDEVQAQVHQLLLQRHGVEDFQIRNMASLIDTVSETQDTFTWLLGSVAAISLLVGGIGVMNIMLVSVTERTREIGIRLGLGAAAVVAHFGTPVSYSLLPVLLAFGCAFGTGLLFGFLPARKAARLDPVAALATE